jgi:hypothetical protein
MRCSHKHPDHKAISNSIITELSKLFSIIFTYILVFNSIYVRALRLRYLLYRSGEEEISRVALAEFEL